MSWEPKSLVDQHFINGYDLVYEWGKTDKKGKGYNAEK